MNIDIKYDEAQLQRVREMLRAIPQEMPGVISRGINRTARPAKTEIARRLKKELKTDSEQIKKGIILTEATRAHWSAKIGIVKKLIPLIAFRARQTKKGVTYQIGQQGRKLIKSGFFATMPIKSRGFWTNLFLGADVPSRPGHTGVFKRKGKGRLPIQELFGPSLGVAFEGAPEIVKEVTSGLYFKLSRNIDEQIKCVLEKHRKAAAK